MSGVCRHRGILQRLVTRLAKTANKKYCISVSGNHLQGFSFVTAMKV